MKEAHFTYNDSIIYYSVEGNGTPVILLHGFAETSFVWKYQTEYLKKFCKVIVPDLPGYGKSSTLNISIEKTNIEDYADCIYALINFEEIDRCIIIGHSMGGYITLSFAEKYPEKIIAFGFINSTTTADSEEKKQMRLKGIDTIENYGAYSFVKNTTPNLFTQQYKELNTDKLNELISLGKAYNKSSLQQCYYAMMNRISKLNVLQSSNVPVLFIAGSDDKTIPLNNILAQFSLPEICYIHIINNVSHMAMWEAWEKVNGYLEKFINDQA